MPRSKRDTVRGRPPGAPSPESPLLSRRKVFAQRKFAQGVSTPYSGSAPPSPPAASSRAASPVPPPPPPDGPLPKTEDFITFLCFRGTSRLPAHLEKFNHPPLPGSSSGKVDRSFRSSAPATPSSPAVEQDESPSRGGNSARGKDQKTNGLRQNGHAKMSATKHLFPKHNMVSHGRSARGSPSSVSSARSEKTGGAAPALKRAQVVLRKLSHSSLIAKKKSQSAKLRAQKADKQARMLQRLVVSSSLRYPSSGPAIKLTTLKQQRPFARLTRAQIARGARQRPAGAVGRPRGTGGADTGKPRPATAVATTADGKTPAAATERPSASSSSAAAEQSRTTRRPANDAVAKIRQRARMRQQMAGKMRREADRRLRVDTARSSRVGPAKPTALRRSWMSVDARPTRRRSDDDRSSSERPERRTVGGDGLARPKVALASRSKSKFWFWVEEPVPRSDDEEAAPAAERAASPRTLRDGRRVQPEESSESSEEESEEEEDTPPKARTLRDGTVVQAAAVAAKSDKAQPAEQKAKPGRPAATASSAKPTPKKAEKVPEVTKKQTQEKLRKEESSSDEEEPAQTRGRQRRSWLQPGLPASSAPEKGDSPAPAAVKERRGPGRPPARSSSSETETETSRSTTREASRQRTVQAKPKGRPSDAATAKAAKDSPGPAKKVAADPKPAVKKTDTPASKRSAVSSDESSKKDESAKKEKTNPARRGRPSLSQKKKSESSSSEDESERSKSNQKKKPKPAPDSRKKAVSSVTKSESPKPAVTKKKPNGRATAPPPPSSLSGRESRDGKLNRTKKPPAESGESSSESERAPPVLRRPGRPSGGAGAPPPRREPSSSSEEEQEPAVRRPLRAGAASTRRKSWETPPPPPPAAVESSDSETEQSARVTRSRRPDPLPIAGAVRKRAFVPGRRGGWADSSSGTEERPASPPPAGARRRPPTTGSSSSSEERASPPPPPAADKPRRTLRKRSEAFFSYDIIDSDTDDEPVGVARPRGRPPTRPSDGERSTPTRASSATAAVSSTSAAATVRAGSRAGSTDRKPTVEKREASSTATEAGAGTPPPAAKGALKRESSVTRQSADRDSSERSQKKRPRPTSPSSSAKNTPTKKKSSTSRADGSFQSKLKESAQRRISRLTQRRGGGAPRADGSPADTRPAMGVYEFDSDENLASLTSMRQSGETPPGPVKTVSEATSTSEDKPPAPPVERSMCTIATQVNMDEEMPTLADASSGTQTRTAAAQQTDSSQTESSTPAAVVTAEAGVGGPSPQPSQDRSVTPQRPESRPPESATVETPTQSESPAQPVAKVESPSVSQAVPTPSQPQPSPSQSRSAVQPPVRPSAQPATQSAPPTPAQSVAHSVAYSSAQSPLQPAPQPSVHPAPLPPPVAIQPFAQPVSAPPPLAPRPPQPSLAASVVSQQHVAAVSGDPLQMAATPRLIMPVSALLRPPYQLGGGGVGVGVGSRPLQLVSVTAPRCSVQPPPGLVQHQLPPQPPPPPPGAAARFQQVQYQLGAAGLFAGPMSASPYSTGQYPLLPAPPAGKRPLAPATWASSSSGPPLAPADRLAPIKPVHPHSSSADWLRPGDAAAGASARYVPRAPPPGLIRLPSSSGAPLHYPMPYSANALQLTGAPAFAPRLTLLGASQLHGTGVAVLSGPPPPPQLQPQPPPRVAAPLTSPVDSKAAVRAQLRQAAAAAAMAQGAGPSAGGRIDPGAGSPADVKVPLPAMAPAPGRMPIAPVPVAPPASRFVPMPGRPGAAPWPPAHAARATAATTRPTSAPVVTSSPGAVPAPSGRPASATPSRTTKPVSPAMAAAAMASAAARSPAAAVPRPAPLTPHAPAGTNSAAPPRTLTSVPVSAPAPVSATAQAAPSAPAASAVPGPHVPLPAAATVTAQGPASSGIPMRPTATPEKPRGSSAVSAGPGVPSGIEARGSPAAPLQSPPSVAPAAAAASFSPSALPQANSSNSANIAATSESAAAVAAKKRPAEKSAAKASSTAKKSSATPAAVSSPATSASPAAAPSSGAAKPSPKPSTKTADKLSPAAKSSPKTATAAAAAAGKSPTPAARGRKKKTADEAASSSSEAERPSAASPLSPAARGRPRKPDREERDSGRESTPQSRRSSQSPAPAKRARKMSSLELSALQEAPVFRPTEKEFADPLGYIEKIRPQAEQFGLCRVVPPPGFKPECRVDDDMRFVAYNHYVHKVFRRWGPNFRELLAIRRYLEQQNIDMEDLPLVGGMEVDLPGLYHTVQRLGGLNDVITSRRWPAVADLINMPKCAQDRAVKLEQIYLKYLVGYTMLTEDERKRLRTEVETDWHRREQQARCRQLQAEEEEDSDTDDDDAAECIVKGKTVSLGAFYRVARNTASLLFKQSDPKPEVVEDDYWKVVNERDRHICVYSGSIDCGVQGYGFVCDKKSQTSRLAWNLKVLSNNPGSVLRSMGQVMGVTVPTLHMSMAFTTGCWYSDPHSLPWIEYLHTGAAKVWYSVPAAGGDALRRELAELMPGYLRQQPVWLPSDTAMVPPDLLAARGVPVARAVQQPGEFVISFPRAFTASVGTGYTLSESVFFATPDWLASATDVYEKLKLSGEPGVFSLDRLVLGVCSDPRASLEALARCQPLLLDLQRQQHEQQQRLQQLGITDEEKISSKKGGRSRKSAAPEEEDKECDTCRRTLYSAMVENPSESVVYCLEDATELLRKPGSRLEGLKLQLMYSQGDFEELIHQVDERIAELGSKQSSAKKKQKKSSA